MPDNTDENASKKQQYEARIQVLKEQVKMKMLTQDTYDKACALVAKEIFGDRKEK